MPLLTRADVPEHIRALASPRVLAVRDGRLARNVAERINLPRTVKAEHLANEGGYPSTFSRHRSYAEREYETYRLVVLFLACTGVRFGEMAALKVGRLDLARRRGGCPKFRGTSVAAL